MNLCERAWVHACMPMWVYTRAHFLCDIFLCDIVTNQNSVKFGHEKGRQVVPFSKREYDSREIISLRPDGLD